MAPLHLTSQFARPPTCRFCRQLMDHGVRYGPAHYAHFECFLRSGKPLAKVSLGGLELFPWDLLLSHGRLDEALTAIAVKRQDQM